MHTFSQFLLRNVTLTLIFIISISAVSLLMLSSLLDKATQYNQVISLLTHQVVTTGSEIAAAKHIAKNANKPQRTTF
jgi:uncharacterized membrane protein